jgi:hypothetical protein
MDAQLIQEIKNEILGLQAKLDEITARNTPKVMPEYDLDIALTMYADHIKKDFERISPKTKYPEAKFDVTFERGRKFIKVVKSSWGSTSVHSFICIVPHDQWKFGDILKAASWAQPAKNFARGNVLNPSSYSNHRWTGA